MSNQWFKFYGGEYLSDPKIERLSPVERSCWVTLLCLASMTEDGVVEFLTIESLLNKSGIQFDPYNPEEWEKSLSVITKFQNMRMIDAREDGSIAITNWSKRQEKTALTGYERIKKYRENKANLKNDNENDNAMITDDNGNDNARIDKNRIDKNKKKGIDLPDWLNKTKWAEWIAYRKERGVTCTETTIKRQIKLLEAYKDQHTEIIEKSITNGWQGLFPEKGRVSEIKVEKGKFDQIQSTKI